MRNHAVLVLLTIATQGIAQAALARVQPIGMAQVMSRATGLQAHPNEDGLLGFGAGYFARFREHEVRYDVAQLRGAAPAFIALSAPAVTRGGIAVAIGADVVPVAWDRRATYSRGNGIEEGYDVGPDGIELSWTFDERPPGEGDLVVRYAVETTMGDPSAGSDGLRFANESCGVTIGRVTGVDRTGTKVAGAVQWDGTGVSLSLPADFVARASYPIVLDPVLGSTFSVAGPANLSLGDACYDATSDRWLIAWKVEVSPNSVVLAQLVSNASGALIGNALVLALNNDVGVPRVANNGQRDEFAVAFETRGTSAHVVVSRVSATTGALLGPITVDTNSFTFTDINIGALVEPQAGSNTGFTVTYKDWDLLNLPIQVIRLTYLPSGALTLGPVLSTLWADNGSTEFSNPRLSRAAAADGKLLAVAARRAGSAGYSIVARLLDAGNDSPASSVTLVQSTGQSTLNQQFVDVDGYAGHWAIAYDSPGLGTPSGPGVRVRPVAMDNTSGGLVVGAGSAFGGFLTDQASIPAVAFATGRVWLEYYSAAISFPGTTSVRQVVAVDAGSCQTCGDSFAVPLSPSSAVLSMLLNRCIATTTSGGVVNGEDALFVWADPVPNTSTSTLSARRLRDFGTVGTTTNLGGHCGTTGTLAFNHPPGIGSSGFRCTLSGLPPTALLPIFNFSPPTSTFPCGACVWTPFSVTLTPPILGGAAFVEFPIPCLIALVGQQFETQWTVVDLTQSPCPVLPGLVPSDRTLLTIGN
ncbi:MAG TPA: hypothetical protein VFZ65_09195 [Planctomycetota bacterium]|nr:hypothetical protein [Planctomycetota bacterium]